LLLLPNSERQMKHILVTVIFLMIILKAAFCQGNKGSTNDSGDLYLSLKNINFVKNNEYFNPIIEGYTLIGYFIQPSIVYSPCKNLKLNIGTHLLNYAGADKIRQIKLVFSTTYNFSENTFLTLGTLNGSDKHRMLDPHFDNERLYNAYVEDGLQFVTGNDNLFNDTWLSWENFIYKGDATREVFTFGESFKYSSPEISDIYNVEVPMQLQFKHYGGQISNYDENVETYLNFATGVRINFDISGAKFGTAGIEYLQFINNELTKGGENGLTKGYASWLRFHYNYKVFYFGSYYWKSHNFFAPNGNAIYSSVSTIKDGLVLPDRTIWTNSLYLTAHPVGNLEIFLGFDTYYDLKRKRMDTATTLHLNFEKLIRLATIKH
jgi:hypothetical protein